MLGRVGTHFQPKHAVGIGESAVAHNYVPVVQALAAQCQAGVNRAEGAALHNDVVVRAVVRVFVGIRSLAAFQHNGVVVNVHVTAADKYVVAVINVNRVATGRFHAGGRRVDVAADVLHVVAAVQVIGPERTVD